MHMDGGLPLEVALLQEVLSAHFEEKKLFFFSSYKVSDIPGVVHVLGHFDLGHSFAICLESSPHVKVIDTSYRKNIF